MASQEELKKGAIAELARRELASRHLIENPELQLKPRGDIREGLLDAGISIGRAALGEVLGGLAGAVVLPVVGKEQGLEAGLEASVKAIEGTRAFITGEPITQKGEQFVENVGKAAEFGADVVRQPIAGLTGLASLPFGGPELAAENIQRIDERGVGPVLGGITTDVTGSPAVGAAVSIIPEAILIALGIKGLQRTSPKLQGVSDDIIPLLERKGIDPTDASPPNVKRVREVIEQHTAEQQARIDAFKEVGIDRPTTAQISRRADDFQKQQEVSKTSGKVRSELERQEAQLTQFVDETIAGTGGKPVASGSTVVDEVVGRSTRLDDEIGLLYEEARNRGARLRPSESGKSVGIQETFNARKSRFIDPDLFVKAINRIMPSDRAMKGLPSSIRGNLQTRGIIDNKGKIKRNISVNEAQEIRQFINDHFDSTSGQGRRAIRSVKNSLDNAVFKAAGQDLFKQANAAKTKFETDLSNAKISKFDKQTKSLVKDILENKIDPDSLVQKITSSKSYRASDLKQLKDYLNQTEGGRQAFNDLRAQTLQLVKEKSFIGPVDSAGFQALTRAKLQSALSSIGEARLNVLFTKPEINVINRLLEVAKLREPVRSTGAGLGPSAQAIGSLRQLIESRPIIGNLVVSIEINRAGEAVLKGAAKPAEVGVRRTPPSALLVPSAASPGE